MRLAAHRFMTAWGVMRVACAHLVLASADVPGIWRSSATAIAVAPHVATESFAEQPSALRNAFVGLAGATAQTLSTAPSRDMHRRAVTVDGADSPPRHAGARSGRAS